MTALTILIIRHAEKPGEIFPGPGLTIEGKENDKSLVLRGWQRAGAWAALFGSLDHNAYSRPDTVYAANPSKAPTETENVTQRPHETILPLCKRLAIAPTSTYGVGDEEELVAEVMGRTGTVLICWEHKKIGEAILPRVAAGWGIPGLPNRWDPDRFDVVLRFDREAPLAPWRFRQLFPRLLDGDTEDPL